MRLLYEDRYRAIQNRDAFLPRGWEVVKMKGERFFIARTGSPYGWTFDRDVRIDVENSNVYDLQTGESLKTCKVV